MKCTIPEISWHNRDPVLCIDIQSGSNGGIYKLVTGGTDTHVVIWQLTILDNGAVAVEMLSDLNRHNRAVNAARFSPDGQFLATSDDEAALLIWKKSETSTNDFFLEDKEVENKEHWAVFKMLRGHIEDISDLSWSKCSQFLVSGSVDNSAIMWDVNKGKNIGLLKDHKGLVQGVAWDPVGQYVVTLCSDRTLRWHNATTKKVLHKVLKYANKDDEGAKPSHLFHDDTLKSFCRRLSFSPDGELLAVPSGIFETEEGSSTNCTYIFSRLCLSKPIFCLPSKNKFSVAVRWCPILFELKTNKQNGKSSTNLVELPYRMVFAVATQNAILIHDTQQPIPLARISDIHYTRLSDISWSSDGRILTGASTDGYCSLVCFNENELGTPYKPPTQETVEPMDLNLTLNSVRDITDTSSLEASPPPKPIETVIPVETKPKIATPIQIKSSKTGKRVQLITLSSKPPLPKPSLVKPVFSDIPTTSCALVEDLPKIAPITPKAPRRVNLITLSSPKNVNKS